jgi:deoxyribonuclease IV
VSQPVGAHIWGVDPLREADEVGADCIQLFLSDPQGWEKPPPRDDADDLRASDVGVYVHAPYLINVCSPRTNVRYGSRKILDQTCEAAAAVGALAVIVHPGHSEDGLDEGVGRWVRTLERMKSDVPVFLENTAGGDHAVARRFDALARLWEVIGEYGVGFCLDTCHAHAGGEDLLGIVDRVKAITGRVDLVHANDSRDAFDSGADRHANIGKGQIDPDLIVAVLRAAGAPAVVETPAEGQAADIATLRAGLPA